MKEENIDLLLGFLNQVATYGENIIASIPKDILDSLNTKKFDLLDDIIYDILDFFLYLTACGKDIKQYSSVERIFFHQLLIILHPFSSDINNRIPSDLNEELIDSYLDMYAFTHNEVSKNININKFELPFSFTLLYFFDEKHHKNFKANELALFCEGLYGIFTRLGKDYIESTSDNNEFKVAYYTQAKNILLHFIIEMYDTFGINIENKEEKNDYTLNKDNNIKDNNEGNNILNKTLEESMNELNELIGLKKVKDEVNTIINLITIKNLRESKGLKQSSMSLHLVFTGNPGTGKTTVARILGSIYKSLGVLPKGHLIEVDRSGIVAGYVGQTAIKTQEVIQKALGGILFIDEAYALSSNENDSDFGKEAIDTLLKAMEDNRDNLIVIVAGYSEPMKKFLKSNPGLESRFNTFIQFDDYNGIELHKIFANLCNKYHYTMEPETEKNFIQYFQNMEFNKNDNFANAREVRNIFENIIKNQANRLASYSNISDKDLLEIKIEDYFI